MKTSILLLNILFFSCIFGCSAKTHPVTTVNDEEIVKQRIENLVIEVEKEEEEEKATISENDPDSITKLEKYSVYREYYKQGNFTDAYPFWTWVILNAPDFRKTTYLDGVEMLTRFITSEQNPDRKEKLIDSLMFVYDTRIKYFGEEGFVLGRKGSDLFKFRPSAYEEAYKYLEKSIELEGDKSVATSTFYYIYATTFMKKYKKIDEQKLIENFLKTNDIVQVNISNDPNWEAVYQNILVLVKDYLDCDLLVSNFGKLYEQNKENLAALKRFQSVLEARSCLDNTTYINISERVFEMEPSAKAANSLALYFLNKENYNRAVFYFDKAIENETENMQKSKYALNLAETYRRANNLSASRAAAQRAISLNPEDGTPHILIGNLYAASSNSCGSTAFEQKAVFWAAVDQYVIARSKGSSEAADLISRYSKAFPSKEEAFYQDPPVKDGDSYTVGCWINATTTVRFVQ